MTNQIRKKASFQERAERLELVRQEYIKFRDRIQKDFTFDADDGRIVFVKNILSLTRSTVVFLHLFHRCGENQELGLDIFGLSSAASIGPQVRNTNKFLKLSWCVQFQFQIETLFKNILKSLGEQVPSGYWKITKQLFTTLSIKNSNYWQDVLNILAFIRNSQHANGTHLAYKKTDTTTIVDGVTYHFKNGDIIRCATWDHIAHAWINLLPTLIDVYYNNCVKIIKKIPSYYYEN